MLLLASGDISRVDCSADAPSALRRIAEIQPPLLLLDAGLAEDQAWVVLEQARRMWPQVRSIMLVHTMEQEQRARSMHSDAILYVGFSGESLYATVRCLLAADHT